MAKPTAKITCPCGVIRSGWRRDGEHRDVSVLRTGQWSGGASGTGKKARYLRSLWGKKPGKGRIDKARLQADIDAYPDATLKARGKRFEVSDVAILRVLQRMKITYKKNCYTPSGMKHPVPCGRRRYAIVTPKHWCIWMNALC